MLKQYDFGKVGKCCICSRTGLRSCYFGYKDPKIHRMFGLNGTHVMSSIGTYYSDGIRAEHPKEGIVETPFVCKTCDKKHFDQRYKDENGNNPHGTPLTETGRRVSTVDKETWLKKCKEAEQRAIEYREKNKQQNRNIDWTEVIVQLLKPR